jgi:hypothetical protein
MLYQLPESLFIAAIPPPLALLDGIDETRFRQNRHVMRNSRLRKPHALFNVPGAQSGISQGWARTWDLRWREACDQEN